MSGERFNIYFTDAEHDLYLYLKTMKSPSEYVKSCIRTNQAAKEFGGLDAIMPEVDPYQLSIIDELFKRSYGDILEIGENEFINVCGFGIRDAMNGRRTILTNLCKGDLRLRDKVIDYAKAKLPKLGKYL